MSRRRAISLPDAFYDDGLITEVVKVIRSGKEATVYCCRAGPSTRAEYLAAKVYRPREVRSFKNDAVYQQGRVIQASESPDGMTVGRGRTDRRLQRAVRKRSRMGREVQFAAWIAQEYNTLGRLHAAGADVPRVFDGSESAILMEFVGDGSIPAPQLADVALTADEAPGLFRRILRNVEICLACDVVHGDLSAFNILYRDGRVTLIDFPQSVEPRVNPAARMLLERDVTNLCDYFAAYGVRAEPSRLASQLWSRYRRGDL